MSKVFGTPYHEGLSCSPIHSRLGHDGNCCQPKVLPAWCGAARVRNAESSAPERSRGEDGSGMEVSLNCHRTKFAKFA